MSEERAPVTRIEMPDGTEVWARISGGEELVDPGSGPRFTDIGARDTAQRALARVEGLAGVVTGVARSLAEPLRAVRPDEVSVEFGIELTAKSGKVVSLLADGEAKGSIKVTLTWNGGTPVAPTAVTQVPAQAPGPPAATQPVRPPAAPATDPPSVDPPAGSSTGAPAHASGAGPDDGSGS